MKVVFCRGLQSAGKSTFAKAFVSENDGWVRVNRDDLRRQAGKYWVPSREPLITAWEKMMVQEALDAGYNVVVDAMNLNQHHTRMWIDSLSVLYPNIEIEIKVFDTPLEECIRRDALRVETVGEEVIRNTYKKYFT